MTEDRSIPAILRAFESIIPGDGVTLDAVHATTQGSPVPHFVVRIRVYVADADHYGAATNNIPAVPVRDETVADIIAATLEQAILAARGSGPRNISSH